MIIRFSGKVLGGFRTRQFQVENLGPGNFKRGNYHMAQQGFTRTPGGDAAHSRHYAFPP
jgi:hypothetical protein